MFSKKEEKEETAEEAFVEEVMHSVEKAKGDCAKKGPWNPLHALTKTE